MSKEDPVHYRNLLPLDSVLEEAAPMMHWRTCSVIEWSSPIHWWWNTWTQTFHSCPPALYRSNPPLLLKIFPIACTEIWTGISASLSETFIHVSFYHLYHWAWEAPFSTPPRPFVTLRVLKYVWACWMHNQCNIQGLLLFFFFPYLYNVFV